MYAPYGKKSNAVHPAGLGKVSKRSARTEQRGDEFWARLREEVLKAMKAEDILVPSDSDDEMKP